MITLTRITPPAREPLYLDEVKDHLRIEHDDDDALLLAQITTAREQIDGVTSPLGIALVTQTWDMKIDHFKNCIDIPLPPLQSVTHVKYLDDEQDEQTVDADVYRVLNVGQRSPGRIELAHRASWPSAICIAEAITIRFVAGYGDANDVPQIIREAMLRYIAHRYENRELGVVGTIWTDFPDVADMLSPFRQFYSIA
jgi:uncharacterized phiE125 gp8 family phage protein